MDEDEDEGEGEEGSAGRLSSLFSVVQDRDGLETRARAKPKGFGLGTYFPKRAE